MKIGLNKREKYLVFFALALAIGYASYSLALKPAYAAYDKAKITYDKVSNEKARIEENLANEEVFKAKFSTAEAGYNQSKERYPDVMTNEDIDKMVTGLCVKNNIRPTLLGLSVRKIEEPLPVLSEEDADAKMEADAKLLEQELLDGEIAESTLPVKEDISIFVVTTATVKGVGSYEDLKKLINDIDTLDYMRVISLQFSSSNNTAIVPLESLPATELIVEIIMEDETLLKQGATPLSDENNASGQ